MASSSGIEISKSSRSDACPAVSTGPIARGSASPRSMRDDLEHPGVLGDDVPGPAQQHLALGGAVGQHGEPVDVLHLAQEVARRARRAASSHSRRRSP